MSRVFSEYSTKRFFAEPEVYKNTGEMLRVIRSYTRGKFPCDDSHSKLSQSAKTMEKTALDLKGNVARPAIYIQTYPDKLSAASPGNPVGVTKPSLLLLFVQQDKKSLEELTSLKETYLWTIFGNKSMRKVRSESKLASKPTFYTSLNLLLNSSDMYHFEAR